MTRDAWAAAALTLFGLLALNEARRLRFGSITAPGPGFVPVCLAALFTLVCAVLLVRSLRAQRSDRLPAPGADVAASPEASAASRWKAVGTLAVLFVYAALLEPLGFVASTFALLVFFFRALDGQRWMTAVVASLATSALTYLAFAHWLHVRLPAGVLRP